MLFNDKCEVVGGWYEWFYERSPLASYYKLRDLEQDGFLRPFDVATVLWPAEYLLAFWAADRSHTLVPSACSAALPAAYRPPSGPACVPSCKSRPRARPGRGGLLRDASHGGARVAGAGPWPPGPGLAGLLDHRAARGRPGAPREKGMSSAVCEAVLGTP